MSTGDPRAGYVIRHAMDTFRRDEDARLGQAEQLLKTLTMSPNSCSS